MKVVKFGGSSLATGAQLEKVFKIVTSDPERTVVVVSAPGKRNAEDTKVTDLLINCAKQYLLFGEAPELEESIVSRYSNIADELGLSNDVIDLIRSDLSQLLEGDQQDPDRYIDSIKASGEDHHAKLVAAYFRHQGADAHYVSPKDAGLFVTSEPGNAQVQPESYQNLSKLKKQQGIIIFPGFFGFNDHGDMITFSRSGSDITGSILANALKADLYENFTDVDAVYCVNPSIVSNPKEIRELTYREMRELSYAGFSVFHDEALIPAYRANIPVQIKNTNNPDAEGTTVVPKRDSTNGPVVGIASDSGFCSIYISKYLMNREIGFGRRVLQILEDDRLTYEHIPSGIDDTTIILRQDQMDKTIENRIMKRIKDELDADEVTIEHHIALVMVVGQAMRHNVGTTARAAKALSDAQVNIEMINQGSSEVSIMFGVKEAQEKQAVHALYKAFFEKALI
ncbi:aspartate kinase [Bacillus sp. WMMC1349]|uniref:aspartate kinase n=1 Tax=Bacillus sp. WMMC1349 TaxID=2736254 RepID=UPI001552D555|nr:aspartate kinase [Bacillus sp. WMMC1349]NPC91521.1 aspartate kinase [Bacillus sp. WMMC1349]